MNRGRPSEQLQKITLEGMVWQVVCKYIKEKKTSLTVKTLEEMTGRTGPAIVKTLAWKAYSQTTGRKKPINTRKPKHN